MTKISTDISIDYRPTLDRYIEWPPSDYRPSVDRPSTECWPITDLIKCPPTIGEESAKWRWWSTGERKAISAEIHLERLSTVSRPSVDRLSSESRLTIDRYIDRVSTEYRPLYRPIDRSTLPTVNMQPSYENERISIKNSLPYLKWVLRLSCVVHGPIYGRFMGLLYREKTVYIKTQKTALNRPVEHTGEM